MRLVETGERTEGSGGSVRAAGVREWTDVAIRYLFRDLFVKDVGAIGRQRRKWPLESSSRGGLLG